MLNGCGRLNGDGSFFVFRDEYLHNKGVELIKRYDVITAILLDNENNHPGCPLSRWRLSGYEKR